MRHRTEREPVPPMPTIPIAVIAPSFRTLMSGWVFRAMGHSSCEVRKPAPGEANCA